MLQRAASSAYSWWWASHIRTKQSKWLCSSLQEMEERITSMLKLVEEDADSFAKKAEMYFRRRPELINFVQEFYKSYRALAERYDHISGELQKANNTIAAVFPDKHFGMDDEDETSSQISPSESLRHSSNFCEISPTTVNDPIKYKEVELDSTEHNQGSEGPTSQTTTDDAKEEIENLQKEILILQTEKEFIKVSYESVLTKYWNIEKDIAEMQEKIYGLQNETSTTTAIEDDEARALMAVTALKSCEETLIKLQEQQKGTVEEAKVESERIKSIKEKLIALKGNANHQVKGEYSSQEDVQQSPIHEDIQAVYNMNQGQNEMQSIYQKVRRSFKSRSETSVMDFADKMDDLVAKVVSMEIEVSSQTTQIHRLRKENDELSNHLQHIQNENRVITGDSKGLSGRFRQVDAELQRIKDLDTSIHNARNVLRSHFSEACHSFKDLSSRLQSPENQEYTVAVGSCGTEDFDHNGKIHQDFKSMESWKYSTDGPSEKNSMPTTDSESRNNNIVQENALETSLPDCSTQDEKHYCIDTDYLGKESDKDSGCPNWQLSLARLEEKQKIVLTEYTSILRNYKETKRKLAEADKKSQEYILETTDQIRDLKNSIVMKDEEIRTLRQKLSYMEASWNQNADTNRSEPKPPMTNTFLRKGQQKISYSRSFNFILGKMSTARLKDGGDSVLCSVEEGVELGDSLTGRSPFVDPKAQKVDAKSASSAIEEKFRREIDELLEENLGFWLRFGSSFQHIQTYETTIEDLQNNIKELKDQRKRGGSATRSAKADATFFDRQLRDLQTDLAVWIEQNGLLKEELHIKFSSLCNIKEDIVRVCNEGGIKEGEQLTAYQGSRFIGEIADMQQENNKVAEELQAGLAYAKNLQAVVQRMLAELNETFDISRTEGSNENHFRRSSSKIRVPLRNYLFGVKPKKQSIFFCMSPEMQKQFSDLTAAQVL